MKLNQEELFKIKGGALALSAALLNAISRTLSTVLEIGRTIGTSIRMAFSKKVC